MWLKLCPLNIFTILCSTEEWLPLCDIFILIFPMPTFFSPGIFPAQALSFFLLFFSPCSHLEKASRGDVFYLTIFTDTAMAFPVAFYQLPELNFPSQNIYRYCFSPIIQTLHLSKANWLNYLPLPYFPLLHTHTTHCTLSKDLLFFCSFSEFVCLDSDAPAGLKKKCNANKL